MNHEPLVSAIIPAFNSAGSLRRCLESALEQTWEPVEIIVVDDGSTDDTARVARECGARECGARENGGRLRLIEQANAGQGAARNAGLAVARGDYIAFLDADDYWLPEFLRTTVGWLEASRETVAVLTAWEKRLDETNSQIVPPLMQSTDRPSEPIILPHFYRFWREQGHFQTGAILLRRSAVDRVGGMRSDLRVSQDLEYWAMIASVGKWSFLPEVLFVNNSRLAARDCWLEKYRQRRRLCPTVEQWEQRIRPTLQPDDWEDYIAVRGGIAAAYVHNMINGGRDAEALGLLKTYGAEMPDGRATEWLKRFARGGAVGWKIACAALRRRERSKAARLAREVRRRNRQGRAADASVAGP